MKKLLVIISTLSVLVSGALADIVYVTARPQGCTVTANCTGANTDGTYTEFFAGLGDFGAAGTALGHPQTTVARTYISSPEITDLTYGVDLTPTFAIPGAVYQIDYNFNSVAGNASTNVVMSVSAIGGTLSFTNTDKFQRQYGNPANQWQFMGFVTNNVGSATPTIQFRYQSGRVSGAGAGAAGNRLLFDCWRFTLAQPCLAIAPVNVTGPLSTNVNQVVVSGISASATNVTVYQDSGSGMVLIGQKTNGVVAENNTITVSGLVRGAQVAATQTINGQEGCLPTIGTPVGGGANPRVRVVLGIRETSDTGPVGAPATDTANTGIHFLGASDLLGPPGTLSGAPAGGTLIYPSNEWQTVTFLRGTNEVVGDSANAVGTPDVGAGYNPGDTVAIQAYAFRTLPNGVSIFSATPAQSTDVSSNDLFLVNWAWNTVPGADGYRLLRSLNSAGFNEFVDVIGNVYNDSNTGWASGAVVTPTASQGGSSIRWNPQPAANTNNLPGTWGILESIGLAIDDLDDAGPHDLYIDNLQNGSTVWQTFENSVGGAQEVTFRSPSFSGTTGGNILSAPNRSIVSVRAAHTGTKSLRVRFQWATAASTRWLRLTTSGANPLVNLDEPISFQLLLLPVGSTPTPPPPPTLSITNSANQIVLDWTGAHNLQAASLVAGTYTNVPSVTTGPWTNTLAAPEKFFRLADPYDN